MRRKSNIEEDYDYDTEDYDDSPRKFRKTDREDKEKRKKWDRESYYDRDHDYDERR